MESQVTQIEECKFKIVGTANALEIMDKRAVVEGMFKKAPIKGYREGKADLFAIRATYGKQIEDALKRALTEDCYHAAIFDQKLKVQGAPNFKSMLLDGGKFSCEFEIMTKPDFTMTEWKSWEIPKPHATASAVDLAEQMLQDLRAKLGDVLPYVDKDFVQNGDNVIVDYEGTVDGEKVEALTVQGEMITVGSGPLKDFDQNLLGMELGDVREFDFIAPADGFPSLAGKTIHFKVSLNMGSKTVPCALNDEMAARVGKKDFNELKEVVGQAAFARSGEMERMGKQEAIARKLVAENTIKVPAWMSLSEAQYIAQQSKMNWEVMSDQDKEKMIEVAEQNVKLALILDRIREDEPEAQLSDQEVLDIIKQNLAQTYKDKNPNELIQELNKSGQLNQLASRIRDEYAIDVCVKTVKFVE